MKIRHAIIVAAIFASTAGAASAKVYDFTFTTNNDFSTGDYVIGTFTTNASDELISASGSVHLPGLDDTNGFSSNNFSLAGSAGPVNSTPSGAYIYDNDYPVDAYGLYLTTFGGREINVYADTLAAGPSAINSEPPIAAGQGPKPAWVGIYDTSNGLNVQEAGTLTISAVPEPATWAMMLLGLGGLGVAMRSRRTQAATPQGAL